MIFGIRLGMTSPQWVTSRLNEYLEIFDHPKMFRFFHVPIQSGSDSVLQRMKREGSVGDFERIHQEYIHKFPDATFLTDLIVGFPGETNAEAQATLDLVSRLQLPGINVSRFSPRPGTLAARMTPVPQHVVKSRTKQLTDKMKEIAMAYHAERIGRYERVLIDQPRSDGQSQGRTDAYRSVLLEQNLPLGAWVMTEIIHAANFSFRGRLVEHTSGANIAVPA